MSKHLVQRWRRIARQWNDVANAYRERHHPLTRDVPELIRAEAHARAFTECADSLERSLVIAAGKPREQFGRRQGWT